MTTKVLNLSKSKFHSSSCFTKLFRKKLFGYQDHSGVMLTLLPTNVAPQNSAVGRSHGVESFQNVDMALSFCMCVCFLFSCCVFIQICHFQSFSFPQLKSGALQCEKSIVKKIIDQGFGINFPLCITSTKRLMQKYL